MMRTVFFVMPDGFTFRIRCFTDVSRELQHMQKNVNIENYD
jgi:hypothetical protein